jgi:hypothetical protein
MYNEREDIFYLYYFHPSKNMERKVGILEIPQFQFYPNGRRYIYVRVAPQVRAEPG